MPFSSSVMGIVAVGGLVAVAALPQPAGSPTASASGSVGVAAVAGSAGPAPLRRAPFVWPLSPVPRVLRVFSVGPHPWSPGHRGVDLAAVPGQAVLAAGPGVVTFADRVARRGVVVVAHDGGLRTTYEPVTADVGVGLAVTAGARIGTLEARAGHCAGPCLHWGALRGDVYVDPLSLVGLLPLPVLLPDVEPVS